VGSDADGLLRIARRDGGLLVLDGDRLAAEFFTRDPSSIGTGAYDLVAPTTSPSVIEVADIQALNRTMRARSAHDRWAGVVGIELPWLAAIPTDLDLIETDHMRWNEIEADRLVADALAGSVRAGIGPSVATKLLHMKRPRFFPILDSLVAQMLGDPTPEGPAPLRAEWASKLVLHVRDQGRDNIEALRWIQDSLATRFGARRTLVRILDGIIWLSHPMAAMQGVRRTFECRVLDSGPPSS
jgi:hypothetical protein